jgi:hypothetical protein
MVELTGKPTENISNIQDIRNTISSNDSSGKTGLMVDYAAGSKLESNILALKGIAIQQAGYLKKMVGYQETMLGNARRESVSSVATVSSESKYGNNEQGRSKSDSLGSVLAAAGSGGLMALLGPLGLQAAAGMLLRGGAGNGRLNGGSGNDRLNVNADAKPLRPKYLTVDERLAAIAEDKRLAAIAENKRLAAIADQSPPKKLPIKYLTVDERLAAAALDGKTPTLKPMAPINAVPEPFKLTQDMRVAISEMPNTPSIKPPTSSRLLGLLGRGARVAGPVGAVVGTGLSGYQGYNDQDLIDKGISERGRITQGVLEGFTGTSDFVTEQMISNPINAVTGVLNYGLGKLGVESQIPKVDLSVTDMFRNFMVDNVLQTEEQAVEARKQLIPEMNAILRQAAYDPMNPDRDRQRISPNAPDLYVPDKTLAQPQAAPIVIAPPAAPASSVVNSNNQQTTIVNQTKDVSASLYSQMLGGDRR